MHLHILGIGGTFMGGIAAIAREAGHTVTGCDANIYPPMSTQLEALGIEMVEGYSAAQLDGAARTAEVFVVGNAISRGNPLLEELFDRGLPFVSGPQWLHENVLRDRWVLAVAGTHGKTTTASMLAFILERAGLHPGFLIGGVPVDFGISARLGGADQTGGGRRYFVVEADEYDTAFFDKRSKFVHYRPRTAILNNLEYDHADIFPDLSAIETQFHHFVRTVPRNGRLIVNAGDAALARVLARGAWSGIDTFGEAEGASRFTIDAEGAIAFDGVDQGRLEFGQTGRHNRLNALAAIAAARQAGVDVAAGIAALADFRGVRRRMERKGIAAGVTVYDDFAHHPSAIAATLAGLREVVGAGRILAVLEPRSNSMKMGVHQGTLAGSLAAADVVFCHAAKLGWDAAAALAPLRERAQVFGDMDALVNAIVAAARPGDSVLAMSNGDFGGIHDRLLAALARRG